MGAGQFRKFVEKIDLVESVDEAVEILRYKAEELSINLTTHYENLKAVTE